MPRSRIQIEPHLDYSELTRCYRSCHDGKERIRWLIIRLLSRPNNPMKVEQVAEITGMSADGIRKIARRYNLTGPDGLKDGHSRHPGGKSKVLTEEQLKQLYERLQTPPDDGGLWSGPKVGELIQQYFGIKVHRTTEWDYLKRLGFTLQVPRPIHTQSATAEAQVIFKQELKEFVRLMRWLCPHKQVEIWTEDEARLGLKPVIRRTWALKGQRPIAHHHPRYQWLYTYGFVNPRTGESCLLILPRVNSNVMQLALEEFDKQVNPQNNKLLILLMDRAGWHTTKKLKGLNNIIIYPIPAYTPKLNPTECIWPLIRECLANKSFNNLDELENILAQRCLWLMEHPTVIKGVAGFKWLQTM